MPEIFDEILLLHECANEPIINAVLCFEDFYSVVKLNCSIPLKRGLVLFLYDDRLQ